jgi:hypothetical protein
LTLSILRRILDDISQIFREFAVFPNIISLSPLQCFLDANICMAIVFAGQFCEFHRKIRETTERDSIAIFLKRGLHWVKVSGRNVRKRRYQARGADSTTALTTGKIMRTPSYLPVIDALPPESACARRPGPVR